MATSLTNGEVIRKEKVTPKGIPPCTKPINKGTDEQEQKGVIAPKRAEKKYSRPYNFFLVQVAFKLFNRKVGVDYPHQKNDEEQKNQDFDCVIDKEIQCCSQMGIGTKPKKGIDQPVGNVLYPVEHRLLFNNNLKKNNRNPHL